MDKKASYYFFLGIGGIGMSALARYYLDSGTNVYGYDKTPTALTKKLEKEGATIIYEDRVELLPDEIRKNEDVLVVYTPAIPVTSKLYTEFKRGFQMKKRAAVLGDITKSTTNLSVAGTHGKTTTSCILASIFKHSDKQFSAFLGGISADLGSNYFYQKGASKHFSITEADEFDRSFLQLSPYGAIITSTDADHLDIYEEKTAIEETYSLFAGLVSEPTCLFRAGGTAVKKGETYSVDGPSNFSAVIHEIKQDGSHFSILQNDELFIDNLYLNIPGKHNLENAIGASLLAKKVGVSTEAIRKGLSDFKGIKRRFETVYKAETKVYIDDYAHHPSELKALISSVREIYPNRHITAVFQPHLYSRTRDFMEAFGNELSKVDALVLLPIYPAREEPIPGVTSDKLLEHVSIDSKISVEKSDLMNYLKSTDLDVLLTLGAGDIDLFVEPIKTMYGTN